MAELPIPIEIPWQLLSTTQPLVAGQPRDTAISLFTYLPDPATTADNFPDQSLVFLKVTTTISPSMVSFSSSPSPSLGALLGEGAPCFHAQLDLIVRKKSGELGTIRPYFHAAAPLTREMLQTGVVGAETYEGASSHQAFGRSASQIHETSQSSSRSGSFSTGVTLLGVGLSSNFSSTGVSGQRTVDQVSDTTTRDASQERRELQSHMTRVENVLTVLNTKYLGTPFLRFSLSPRPLEQLSVDSSDPSLWYSQLLQRRSSGIEGIQEYTVLLIVPKGEDFCLTARLRRVCVLDDRPSEPDLNERFDFGDPVHMARVYGYTLRTYPIGTPVDDLDVEIRRGSTGALATSSRPVIEDWAIGGGGQLVAMVVATSPTAPSVLRGSAP